MQVLGEEVLAKCLFMTGAPLHVNQLYSVILLIAGVVGLALASQLFIGSVAHLYRGVWGAGWVL